MSANLALVDMVMSLLSVYVRERRDGGQQISISLTAMQGGPGGWDGARGPGGRGA